MAKKTAPVEFSEDIALAVCGQISLGLSLRKIEVLDGMPTKSAVMMWLLQGEALKAGGQATAIDSTGVGDPIVEELQSGSENYISFKFTQQSKQMLVEG